MTATLGAAFLVGLLGSLHCAGMCGPLAVAAGAGGPGGGARVSLFVGGKALTYVALGWLAGVVGAAFGHPGLGRTGLGVLALGAGAVMVGIGGHTLWRRIRPRVAAGGGAVGTLLQAALRGRGRLVPLAAGLLTGLLPCGLVYAMITQSLAAGSAGRGAAVMAAFGLGTAPALLATGLLSRLLSGRVRGLGETLAALAVVAMGAVAVWRGLAVVVASAGGGGCCHHGA